MRRQGWVLLALLLAAPAAAQVHKCEMPDGSVSYTSDPCPAGEAQALRGISVTPGASPEQQQEMARQRAERQQAARDKHRQRVEATAEKVRSIQRENADPANCADSRQRLARMEEANVPSHSVDLFIVKQSIKLHCYP